MADIDWQAIRLKYITGRMGYKPLADAHKLRYSVLQRRATAERWPAQREEYRKQAADKAIERELENEVDRLATLIRVANHMQDVIANIDKDPDQFHRYLVQDEIYDPECDTPLKTTEERVFKKLDTKAVRDIVAAVKDLLYIVRNLHGMPTQAEAEAQRVAAERLKIEQAKADADTNTDKRIEVVLSEDMEEFAR